MNAAVYGIDPSLTGFAICAYRQGDATDEPRLERHTSQPPADGPPHDRLFGRIARYRGLVSRCLKTLAAFGPPKLAFIEGYSYGSTAGAMLDLAELGGLVRHALLSKYPACQLVEVPPDLLKKFATGKGNAKKEFVMAHVANRYGMLFETNDECDAFVLAQMARCQMGWAAPGNAAQNEAVYVAMHGKPRKAKKRRKAG